MKGAGEDTGGRNPTQAFIDVQIPQRTIVIVKPGMGMKDRVAPLIKAKDKPKK